MDASRFDQLTRLLARRLSRRSAPGGVAGLVGLAAASAALPAGAQDDPGAEEFPCLPFTRCKRLMGAPIDPPGGPWWMDMGEIPGGPYEGTWNWSAAHCVPKDTTPVDLERLCNKAYPRNCENDCLGCTAASLTGCS
jgi:hypothetical protein